MNIFSSKDGSRTEANGPRSPFTRLTRRLSGKKQPVDCRMQFDDCAENKVGSYSASSSPSSSPLLKEHFFNRSHSLPLFKSKTDQRYARISGKAFTVISLNRFRSHVYFVIFVF